MSTNHISWPFFSTHRQLNVTNAQKVEAKSTFCNPGCHVLNHPVDPAQHARVQLTLEPVKDALGKELCLGLSKQVFECRSEGNCVEGEAEVIPRWSSEWQP